MNDLCGCSKRVNKEQISVNRIDGIEEELISMDLHLPLSEKEKRIVSLHKETLELIKKARTTQALANDAVKNNKVVVKMYTDETLLKNLNLTDAQYALLVDLYRNDTAAQAKVAMAILKLRRYQKGLKKKPLQR